MSFHFAVWSQCYPHEGPTKSFKKLTLTGCGFWPSEDIVVRFSRVGVAFVAPRSSLGEFKRDGVISCRPPIFAEPGEYEVALSVNGEDFAQQTLKIHVFEEPVLMSLAPLLVDIRDVEADGYIVVELVRAPL